MTYQVAVLGAGPAGSATARRLALAGARVVLIGGATRPGWEGLSSRTYALLREEGIEATEGIASDPLVRRGQWGKRVLEGAERLTDRADLAAALRAAASAAGAETLCATVRQLARVRRTWRLTCGGRELEAEVLVDARGRRATRRPHTLAGPALLAYGQRFRCAAAVPERGTHLVAADDGWCWWAQNNDRLWMQWVVLPRRLPFRARLAGLLAHVPSLAAALDGAIAETTPIARPAQARLARCPDEEGSWCVGDAAMALDPLSGQGVYEALRSARLVATAVGSVLQGAAEGSARHFVAARHEEAWYRGVHEAARFYRENASRSSFWGEIAAGYERLSARRGAVGRPFTVLAADS